MSPNQSVDKTSPSQVSTSVTSSDSAKSPKSTVHSVVAPNNQECSCETKQQTNSNVPTKSHKVEGKNKKSLHHKQQQQQQQLKASSNQQRPQSCQHLSVAAKNPQTANSQQRPKQNGEDTAPSRRPKSASKPNNNLATTDALPGKACVTLDDFHKRAQELKNDIQRSLEKTSAHKTSDHPIEVVQLKEDILKLSRITASNGGKEDEGAAVKQDEELITDERHNDSASDEKKMPQELSNTNDTDTVSETVLAADAVVESSEERSSADSSVMLVDEKKLDNMEQKCENASQKPNNHVTIGPNGQESSDSHIISEKDATSGYKSDVAFNQALNDFTSDKDALKASISQDAKVNKQKNKKVTKSGSDNHDLPVFEDMAPHQGTLDEKTKFCALMTAFKQQFHASPHLLEPICRQLALLSDQKWQLQVKNERYQSENQKLLLVKHKLENLCRELQKSNNAIRCESLELIKVESEKAKSQTTKIQSTLSGVIKLFDENQQRNMTLRQENQELQTKLKSLLDHCDNWEKSVEATLRQRDIENRLLKTELAKANLSRNEEKEKFLGEKRELLQILSMMQEQQTKIEGQEAKLRSDLSSYASKYDECQAVINKGMNRFQTESKKMLKTIEKSKQDYKVLLAKFTSQSKKMAQLLEEKQYWDRTLSLANKKIETLEKLCRALRDGRKQVEAKTDAINEQRKANKIKHDQQALKQVAINHEAVDCGLDESIDLTQHREIQEPSRETDVTKESVVDETTELEKSEPSNKMTDHELTKQSEQETELTSKVNSSNDNNSLSIETDVLKQQVVT